MVVMCLLGGVSSQRASIGSGSFIPLYGVSESEQTVLVKAFKIDAFPVTNRDFLSFIDEHSDWLPTAVPRVLAEEKFLKHWNRQEGKIVPLEGDLDKPVVNVFGPLPVISVARRGGRLPTVFEWEYVASASGKSVMHRVILNLCSSCWLGMRHRRGVIH